MIGITTKKPKVTDNKRGTMGVRGPLQTEVVLLALLRTQDVDICQRGSAIRRLSVTEGRDRGEIASCGERAVGCQPSESIVAVTEQEDETLWGERRGRPNNRSNYR